jgi:2-keto-4-pentenoate hydratase/2-oxohepta-3-ene-1,7-dioic acid hydratase in catechol pathway
LRWSTYVSEQDGREHAALVENGQLHGLAAGLSLLDLLEGGRESLRDAAEAALRAPFEVVAEEGAEIVAPIPRPPSFRDFMAFENHYVDTRKGLNLKVEPVFYEQPCFYFSNPAAIVGPAERIPMAPGTAQFDFELEIGTIIGRPGADLSPAEALDHVAGYTILCDWSARDLQAKETAFGTGPTKAKDTRTSIGPYLVTPDELEAFRSERGYDLEMKAYVNGNQYSAGNWNSIYWDIPQLLAFASRGTELRTGDIVGTGTVGTGSIMELSAVHGSDRYPWLEPGDEVVLEVAQLGTLRGTVEAGSEVKALA